MRFKHFKFQFRSDDYGSDDVTAIETQVFYVDTHLAENPELTQTGEVQRRKRREIYYIFGDQIFLM